jgi:hypothetical protein
MGRYRQFEMSPIFDSSVVDFVAEFCEVARQINWCISVPLADGPQRVLGDRKQL